MKDVTVNLLQAEVPVQKKHHEMRLVLMSSSRDGLWSDPVGGGMNSKWLQNTSGLGGIFHHRQSFERCPSDKGALVFVSSTLKTHAAEPSQQVVASHLPSPEMDREESGHEQSNWCREISRTTSSRMFVSPLLQ